MPKREKKPEAKKPNPVQVAAVESATAEMVKAVLDDPSFADLPVELRGELALAAVCGELLMRGIDIRGALVANLSMAANPEICAAALAAGGTPQKGARRNSGAIPPEPK